MDLYDQKTRSYVMSRIRGKNTQPEILLRKALFGAGLRGYRAHSSLPGRPDVAFPKARIAVFVDGCFWHGCKRCKIPIPRSNRAYWAPKLARNKERDRRLNRKLRRMGWSVLHFWEHQIVGNPAACAARVARRLRTTLSRGVSA